jgi:hypothetical protein
MANRTCSAWLLAMLFLPWLGCSDDPSGANRSSGSESAPAARAAPTGDDSSGDTLVRVDNPALPAGSAGSAGAVAPMLGAGCAPGHYIGNFSGAYRSAAWLNGEEPLNFATSDFDGMPGFEFWLEAVEEPCPAGTEFCPGAVVKGGKLRGFAQPFTDPAAGADMSDPFALSVRFEIDLTGELDCSTGMFRGQLQNGCYDVLATLYRFSGDMNSAYIQSSSTFTAGTWTVVEMPMDALIPVNPAIGGSGTWDAEFDGPGTSPTVDGSGLCDGMTGFDTP